MGLRQKRDKEMRQVSLISYISGINFNIKFYFGNIGNVFVWVIKQKF